MIDNNFLILLKLIFFFVIFFLLTFLLTKYLSFFAEKTALLVNKFLVIKIFKQKFFFLKDILIYSLNQFYKKCLRFFLGLSPINDVFSFLFFYKGNNIFSKNVGNEASHYLHPKNIFFNISIYEKILFRSNQFIKLLKKRQKHRSFFFLHCKKKKLNNNNNLFMYINNIKFLDVVNEKKKVIYSTRGKISNFIFISFFFIILFKIFKGILCGYKSEKLYKRENLFFLRYFFIEKQLLYNFLEKNILIHLVAFSFYLKNKFLIYFLNVKIFNLFFYLLLLFIDKFFFKLLNYFQIFKFFFKFINVFFFIIVEFLLYRFFISKIVINMFFFCFNILKQKKNIFIFHFQNSIFNFVNIKIFYFMYLLLKYFCFKKFTLNFLKNRNFSFFNLLSIIFSINKNLKMRYLNFSTQNLKKDFINYKIYIKSLKSITKKHFIFSKNVKFTQNFKLFNKIPFEKKILLNNLVRKNFYNFKIRRYKFFFDVNNLKLQIFNRLKYNSISLNKQYIKFYNLKKKKNYFNNDFNYYLMNHNGFLLKEFFYNNNNKLFKFYNFFYKKKVVKDSKYLKLKRFNNNYKFSKFYLKFFYKMNFYKKNFVNFNKRKNLFYFSNHYNKDSCLKFKFLRIKIHSSQIHFIKNLNDNEQREFQFLFSLQKFFNQKIYKLIKNFKSFNIFKFFNQSETLMTFKKLIQIYSKNFGFRNVLWKYDFFDYNFFHKYFIAKRDKFWSYDSINREEYDRDFKVEIWEQNFAINQIVIKSFQDDSSLVKFEKKFEKISIKYLIEFGLQIQLFALLKSLVISYYLYLFWSFIFLYLTCLFLFINLGIFFSCIISLVIYLFFLPLINLIILKIVYYFFKIERICLKLSSKKFLKRINVIFFFCFIVFCFKIIFEILTFRFFKIFSYLEKCLWLSFFGNLSFLKLRFICSFKFDLSKLLFLLGYFIKILFYIYFIIFNLNLLFEFFFFYSFVFIHDFENLFIYFLIIQSFLFFFLLNRFVFLFIYFLPFVRNNIKFLNFMLWLLFPLEKIFSLFINNNIKLFFENQSYFGFIFKDLSSKLKFFNSLKLRGLLEELTIVKHLKIEQIEAELLKIFNK